MSPAARLPAALAAWSAELAIFPIEVALSVGGLVRRLAPVIGPLRQPSHSGQGEVDGFDGLSRTGSYERLLATEWLLASEAPDEFLRRAANREHTFLRLARPEPAGHRTSHVLLDAGPSQLGTPRVAHIAALVVLSRRAAAAGAAFTWGILQRPTAEPFTEVTPATVDQLLDARTAMEATSADLRAWNVRLGGPTAGGDLWLVGGARLDALDGAIAASRLIVSDVLEPDRRQVAAEVREGHRRLSSVTLDLPDDAMTTRLLRDPFGAAPVPALRPGSPPAPRPESNLVFSDNGLRLFARSARGMVYYRIPNSPRDSAGRPGLYSVPQVRSVIAAGRARRDYAFVAARQGGWTVYGHQGPARALTFALPQEYGAVPGVGRLAECHVLLSPSGRRHVFRHDRLLVSTGDGPAAKVLSTNVLASVRLGAALVFVEETPNGASRLVHLSDMRMEEVLGAAHEAWFGFGGPAADAAFGLVALDEGGGRIRIRDARGNRIVRLPSDTRAAGVGRDVRRRSEPGMVALEGDGRTLTLVGDGWTRRLLRASAPIVDLVVASGAACVAWTTTQSELVAYSLDYEVELMRVPLTAA